MDRVMESCDRHDPAGCAAMRCGRRDLSRADPRAPKEFGGDYTAFVPMLPTGRGTSTPHLTWTDEPYKTGEATILELGAARHRYHCPQARTVFLGKPPQKIADTAKVVVEGIAAALDAAKPGATGHEVEAAWRAVISRHGIVEGFAHRLFGGPELRAGLGRAHDQPPPERSERARAEHGAACHSRHLGGRLGHRDQRMRSASRRRARCPSAPPSANCS
jgi:Xaa-Pro aminopeptidase